MWRLGQNSTWGDSRIWESSATPVARNVRANENDSHERRGANVDRVRRDFGRGRSLAGCGRQVPLTAWPASRRFCFSREEFDAVFPAGHVDPGQRGSVACVLCAGTIEEVIIPVDRPGDHVWHLEEIVQMADNYLPNPRSVGLTRDRMRMKAFKQVIRTLSKVMGGIAALVFFRAPFTNTGLALTAGSAAVGAACFAAYMWAEPDDDDSENSN